MVEPTVVITPEMQANLQIEAECFKSLVRFREVHLAGEKDVPSAEFHYPSISRYGPLACLKIRC